MVSSEDASDDIDCVGTHTHFNLLLCDERKLLLDLTGVPVFCRLVGSDYAITHCMMRSCIGLLAGSRGSNLAVHYNVISIYEVIFNQWHECKK